MPKYVWRCPNGCDFEKWSPAKDDGLWPPIAQVAECPTHGVPATRNYRAEFVTQMQVCDDDIRRSWLGTEIDRNLQAQGRPLDPLAPKDKFEAKAVEKALGRIHIGNDYSQLRPISQRAIENGPRTKPGKLVVP